MSKFDEDEGEKFKRLVREGMAKNATPEQTAHEVVKGEGGAWFWYVVIAVLVATAVYKSVAP